MKVLLPIIALSTALLLGACSSGSNDGNNETNNDVTGFPVGGSGGSGSAAVADDDTSAGGGASVDDDEVTVGGTGEGTGGDTGGDTGAGTGGPSNLASLVGLYDDSYDFGDGTVDVWYFEIRADGSLVDYDYQQDSFDQGDNCYFIYRDLILSPLGGDEYLVHEIGSPETGETWTITRSGNVLRATGSAGILFENTVIEGISTDSFNECI